MSRESAFDKGRRYLIEARLRVVTVEEDRIQAVIRGSGVIWHCGWAGGKWWCNCPAKTLCSHLIALQSVVIAPDLERSQPLRRHEQDARIDGKDHPNPFEGGR